MSKVVKKEKYFEAVGRRKSAVARVRLVKGTGSAIEVNGKKSADYFPTAELREIISLPFKVAKTGKELSASVKVNGGGVKAQAEAVRIGISRALLKYKPGLRPLLKTEGFLTRDARIKERRKFGLKKARKAPQWSKR